MSKITKALEKAARERLQHQQKQATVTAQSKTVAFETSSRLGEVASAGRLEIDPHIIVSADASSPIAEQYRILRTNLQSLRLRSGPKVIVVTSAIHGEGKSVTSTNLALILAKQEHLRVALVDGDLRKGTIHQWLGLPEHRDGLSTVLSRGGELNGSLVKLKEPPLTVLPAGPIPENPSELLDSSHMKRLLATLKSEFDLIILDAPPMLPVADPSILAAQSDGVLLVVRAGKTQRSTVLKAKTLLQQQRSTLLGCVLTHVEYYLPSYYRYYHYYRRAEQEKSDPAIAPRPSAVPRRSLGTAALSVSERAPVGDIVVQQPRVGRDVAPIEAEVQVPRAEPVPRCDSGFLGRDPACPGARQRQAREAQGRGMGLHKPPAIDVA